MDKADIQEIIYILNCAGVSHLIPRIFLILGIEMEYDNNEQSWINVNEENSE